jgi:ribosomal protein S18 acetylase RimI-like enzyme
MEIRPLIESDLDQLVEVDGTVESSAYLHVERSGETLQMCWRLQERALRSKLVQSNSISQELDFEFRQVIRGIDEGIALAAEHDEVLVALLLGRIDPGAGVLRLLDLRVDFDSRRQGLGMAMLYQAINHARELGLRAVAAEVPTNNLPASKLLARCGFELAGIDTHRVSNHDLVKETATLLWYAPLD